MQNYTQAKRRKGSQNTLGSDSTRSRMLLASPRPVSSGTRFSNFSVPRARASRLDLEKRLPPSTGFNVVPEIDSTSESLSVMAASCSCQSAESAGGCESRSTFLRMNRSRGYESAGPTKDVAAAVSSQTIQSITADHRER